MKSTEFLQSAMDVQKERGEQYDKPSGERSMAATVSAFNCITGYTLEEADGWMFMGLLKLVRQSQNPEKYHHDSALDFVAYASLYAEAASEQCGQLESREAHAGYKEEEIYSDMPKWSEAPEWAEWIGLDKEGAFWFELEPVLHADGVTWKYPLDSKFDTIHCDALELSKHKRPTSTAK